MLSVAEATEGNVIAEKTYFSGLISGASASLLRSKEIASGRHTALVPLGLDLLDSPSYFPFCGMHQVRKPRYPDPPRPRSPLILQRFPYSPLKLPLAYRPDQTPSYSPYSLSGAQIRQPSRRRSAQYPQSVTLPLLQLSIKVRGLRRCDERSEARYRCREVPKQDLRGREGPKDSDGSNGRYIGGRGGRGVVER